MHSPLGAALFWASVALCTFAHLAILRSVAADRRSGTQASPAVPHPRGVAELAWAIIPAVGLGVVFWFTWRAIQALP